jgi:hypothetical protein
MYIEHRSDRVTPQWAAFHGASANPASLPTKLPEGFITLVVAQKKCTAQIALTRKILLSQ